MRLDFGTIHDNSFVHGDKYSGILLHPVKNTNQMVGSRDIHGNQGMKSPLASSGGTFQVGSNSSSNSSNCGWFWCV